MDERVWSSGGRTLQCQSVAPEGALAATELVSTLTSVCRHSTSTLRVQLYPDVSIFINFVSTCADAYTLFSSLYIGALNVLRRI